MNDMGNNIDVIKNNIKSIEEQLVVINKQIQEIQEKVEKFGIVSNVFSFVSSIAGIAFDGFGFGIVKNISSAIEDGTALVKGVGNLALGTYDENSNTSTKGMIDSIIDIETTTDVSKYTKTSVFNAYSTYSMLQNLSEEFNNFKKEINEKINNITKS